jgi:hypothetical protein
MKIGFWGHNSSVCFEYEVHQSASKENSSGAKILALCKWIFFLLKISTVISSLTPEQEGPNPDTNFG